MSSIFVNQIGYKTNCSKKAYVAIDRLSLSKKQKEEIEKLSFSVIDGMGNSVYTGNLCAPLKDTLADENVSLIDFSSFTHTGSYKIKLNEIEEESFSFKICDFVFDDVYEKTVHYFYLSRCGIDIISNVDNGLWNHPACHTQIAEIYGEPGKTKRVIGGWHDAGDYGRYVIAVSKAAMDLMFTAEALSSCERSSEVSCVRVNVLLSEVHYAMEWMLQMQREDGGVYHKVSGYHFCGFILPHEETDKQVLAPVSTTATADFAGCLAYASVIFKDRDPDFSDTLLQAALKAQTYLDTHEDVVYQNPPEITTGGYGDKNVQDEKYFALCSLYVATGIKTYLEKALEIRKQLKSLPVDPDPRAIKWYLGFGWGSVAGYGSEILLRKGQLSKQVYDDLLSEVIIRADKCLKVYKTASFGTCIEKVFWGSNGHVCDEAHLLLLAYDLTSNDIYCEVARSQLNYILGCNPMDLCYVTACGTQSPKNPHHRPSGALKNTMPGMVAGGPSEWLADEVAKNNLQGKPPLMRYIDQVGSYSTNEIDIYWNSPLVYLIGRML